MKVKPADTPEGFDPLLIQCLYTWNFWESWMWQAKNMMLSLS